MISQRRKKKLKKFLQIDFLKKLYYRIQFILPVRNMRPDRAYEDSAYPAGSAEPASLMASRAVKYAS